MVQRLPTTYSMILPGTVVLPESDGVVGLHPVVHRRDKTVLVMGSRSFLGEAGITVFWAISDLWHTLMSQETSSKIA